MRLNSSTPLPMGMDAWGECGTVSCWVSGRYCFSALPIEELIQTRQKAYYDALGMADKTAQCAGFVELMLEIIRDSLKELPANTDQDAILTDQDKGKTDQDTDQDNPNVRRLLAVLGEETLTATALMTRLGLSHRPTFRKNYLDPALNRGLIQRTIPDKPSSRNQKYRKSVSHPR